MANLKIQFDIDYILHECAGTGSILDELTLLRAALRAYAEGRSASDAVAWACEQLSNSITKHNPVP